MRLKINPELVILHRKGVLFTCVLSNNKAQQQLQLIDSILLSLVIKFSKTKVVIKKFVENDYVKLLAPSIEKVMVEQHIKNLLRLEVLIKEKGSNVTKYIIVNDLREENCHSNTIGSEEKYTLSKNFSLLPKTNGFIIWSSLKKKHYQLNIEELLIIFYISNGKKYCDILNNFRFIEKCLIKTIFSNFIDKGLIIKSKSVSEKNSAEVSFQESKTNYISNDLKSWEDIVPDKRIPVYFVPHMENHFPLALGLLFSSIQSYKNGKLLEKYNLIPITYFTPENLLNVVYRKFGKGVWLFSNYMWSLDLNLKISKLVKTHNSENTIIHGGPSTPNYREANYSFMLENNSIDISVHGEGEIAICEILNVITQNNYDKNLKNVNGITFRQSKNREGIFVRTDDRTRMEKPDAIPSPYINGIFDNYKGRIDAAIVESNRGCPFSCTFCDWGSATSQKVRKYSVERTNQEIDWIGKNKTKIIWVADANFGMYDRDIEISKYIVATKLKYGYPKEVVVNYTKNSTWRLAKIIEIFSKGEIISQGIISIQTTDKVTLDVINRKNIKTTKYDELAEIFEKMKLPLSTDLMIGLPGIKVSTFKKDIQRYIDLDVSVKAYPTQLLPNSPMANPEYLKKYKIKTDKNSYIISSYSFSEDDLMEMKSIYKFYTIADGYSLLRYVIRYLQWEYNIKAIEFLDSLRVFLEKHPERYPLVTWVFKYFDTEKCVPGGWKLFYDEISLYIFKKYKVKDDSLFNTVIDVNLHTMPDDSIKYPINLQLSYDFTKYFNDRNKNEIESSLKDYNEETFKISDPNGLSESNVEEFQYDTHQYFWELQSCIGRAKSSIL